MLAATTTRSGRPKIPALSKPRIMAEQKDWIEDQLAAVKNPQDKLARLHEIEADAHKVIAENEPAMRKQALSLSLHEGARGVYKGIGLSRESWSQATAAALGDWPERPVSWDESVVARATAQGVRFYRNAATDLPPLALKVVTAKARKDVIRPMRDRLVTELSASGLKRTEIAAIIGRTPSRVSHIATKAG